MPAVRVAYVHSPGVGPGVGGERRGAGRRPGSLPRVPHRPRPRLSDLLRGRSRRASQPAATAHRLDQGSIGSRARGLGPSLAARTHADAAGRAGAARGTRSRVASRAPLGDGSGDRRFRRGQHRIGHGILRAHAVTARATRRDSPAWRLFERPDGNRRSAARHLRLVSRLETERPVFAADPAESLEDPDLAVALASLPSADQEVLRLWAWEQLEPREIAQVLGSTANAVSLRLSRARKKLSEELTRQDPSAAGHIGDETTEENRR